MNKRHAFIALLLVSLLAACLSDPSEGTPTPIPTETPTITPTPIPTILKVVYIRDGNIWVWKEDGSKSQLTSQNDVEEARISNDGRVIAFKTKDELFSVDATGGTRRTLLAHDFLAELRPTSGEEVKIGNFDFSPSTGYSVFLNTFIVGGIGNEDLFRIDAVTQVPVRVFAPGQGGVFHVSNDGNIIAFVRPNVLARSDSDGTDVRILFTFPANSGFGTFENPDIVWDDENRFYVVIPGLDGDNRLLGMKRIGFIDEGGNWNPLNDMTVPLFTETHIAPNGRRVAYMFENGDFIDLHIFNVDNGNDAIAISYPRGKIQFIGWVPDSDQFAITLENRSINYASDRPLITTLGGPVRFLTDRSFLPAPTLQWVDNERFLFVGADDKLMLERCNAAVCGEVIAELDTLTRPILQYDFTASALPDSIAP